MHYKEETFSLQLSGGFFFSVFFQSFQKCRDIESAISVLETQGQDGSYFPITVRRYVLVPCTCLCNIFCCCRGGYMVSSKFHLHVHMWEREASGLFTCKQIQSLYDCANVL